MRLKLEILNITSKDGELFIKYKDNNISKIDEISINNFLKIYPITEFFRYLSYNKKIFKHNSKLISKLLPECEYKLIKYISNYNFLNLLNKSFNSYIKNINNNTDNYKLKNYNNVLVNLEYDDCVLKNDLKIYK